jgi:murein DD-endopeptidase MepM/ murein hydrolase activator NlpD
MHLNSFSVAEGDAVTAGKKIGEVGTTGISTGAHLHVSLIIRGVQADPLSLLPLPFRE